MKLADLKDHDTVVSERRRQDLEYSAEADRLALAEAVGLAVVRFRAEHALTQTAFGTLLGWKQPNIARLERGDITPSIETLQRLAHAGVIEVHIEQQRTYVRELVTT